MNPVDVDHLVGDELRRQDREQFLVIHLNTDNTVIGIERVAIGSLTEITMSPREVFKGAILANVNSVILVHQVTSYQVGTTEI